MAAHHEIWAIVNMNNEKRIVTVDGMFYSFSSEIKAWDECLRLRKLNPGIELTVKKTKIPLPWKTYDL
ncbi:hypothetical protein ACQ31_gp018 [Salmonella phage STML-198]|uniref:Uncharacterized protein n=1 Tax=Salmonella phage STML-198 TaxID=1204531 RepID=K4I1U7_9CAUD|nr:hypothetical protein ACQ31_gp018 [Salmonella phage STML-198]AFU63901.1 hypothetical protein [Salmonella phage STML-198]